MIIVEGISMAIRYSNYFGVTPQVFEQKGVFNAFIDQDSKFHIDPLLIRENSIPEFNGAYDFFLNYFRGFVPLAKMAKMPDLSDPFFKRMVDRFVFRELQYTGLGFSEGNSRGTGISGKLSLQLATTAYTIIKAGYEDPEIFALMPIFEDKIGQDRISDMTIAILRRQFLAYTERISVELGLETKRYRFSYDKSYNVPFKGLDTVHFIPRAFLNDLCIAKSYEDIGDATNYNNKLKAKLAELIGVTWNESVKFSKSDWKGVILENRECYEAAIDYYRSIIGVPYNFEDDCHGKYWDLQIAKLASDNPICFFQLLSKSREERVFDWTSKIVEKYKQLIEVNRMSELVYRCKRTPDETDWQLLLYYLAVAYIGGSGLNLDISRENNPGNGEVDFKFSQGKAKTIVEIKRSKNPDILHGYRIQLPAYMRAEQTDYGIFVVIIDDPLDEVPTQTRLEELVMEMKGKGEVVSPIIYVKGYHQSSASKPGYEL